MSLSGIDPFDPTPANRREFKPGSGSSLGTASDIAFLIIGNRTSAGIETVDLISDEPLGDEADAIQRLGARSEAYAMYREIRDQDKLGKVYVGCPTESAGTAAAVPLDVAGASNAASSVVVTINGLEIEVPINDGDTQQITAERIRDYINDADEGRLQVSATAAIDGGGPTWSVTITAAHKGTRSDLLIGSTANRGIRVRAKGPTNTQTVTKDTANYIAGATADDHTAIIAQVDAAARKGLFYYVVTASTATGAPTTTDNGLGELTKALKDLALPANGIDTRLFFGMVGTNAQAVTVQTASAMNWYCAHGIWQENNDYTPAQLAAQCAAFVRTFEVAYPAANVNGLSVNVPKPYLQADNPTPTEITTALNNGVTPLAFANNAMRIVRFITGRSLNAQGANDYRAREAHIARVLHFGWEQFLATYEAQRQPNADADPLPNSPPPTLTTTPSAIKAMHDVLVDQLCSNRPLGRYPGPIFKPSARDEMKAGFSCVYAGGGAFDIQVNWKAVEHNIKTATEIRETGAGY